MSSSTDGRDTTPPKPWKEISYRLTEMLIAYQAGSCTGRTGRGRILPTVATHASSREDVNARQTVARLRHVCSPSPSLDSGPEDRPHYVRQCNLDVRTRYHKQTFLGSCPPLEDDATKMCTVCTRLLCNTDVYKIVRWVSLCTMHYHSHRGAPEGRGLDSNTSDFQVFGIPIDTSSTMSS